jgi:glycosyltransferase involved in cell wall biosynthesis
MTRENRSRGLARGAEVSGGNEGATLKSDSELGDTLDTALNVCLASPIYYPEYSGGATRFHRYVPGLQARGVNVHVVAAEVGAWKRYRRYTNVDRSTDEPAAAAVDDIAVHRVPMPRSRVPGRLERWMAIWQYESAILARCRQPSTRPDVLIWRYPLMPASVRVLFQLRRLGIPMMRVVTMFDDLTRTNLKQRIKRSYQPLPYRFLDCVVVGSSVMRDNLQRLGVRTRIEVIPHGVDLSRFRPNATPSATIPLRRRLGLDAQSEVVLFAGPINHRKGLDYLAAAWDNIAARRPRAHLLLVGPERDDGSQAGSFADRLRLKLERARGADRIIFAGRVIDIEEYFRAADLFVFPSRKEGMPNVVCEAFASGLPCVLTPFLGLPQEFGQPGEQYVLVPHRSDSLAQSIVALLDDQTERTRLGTAARRWAEAHLDVEHALDAYARVCRELAGARRVRSP